MLRLSVVLWGGSCCVPGWPTGTTELHEQTTTASGLQAVEAGRNEEARDACVRKGLKVAATDAAKAKLVRTVATTW